MAAYAYSATSESGALPSTPVSAASMNLVNRSLLFIFYAVLEFTFDLLDGRQVGAVCARQSQAPSLCCSQWCHRESLKPSWVVS